ncbi:helix-turn-helix domain-containing protein [Streptomyces sp. NBC_01171]|uniref:helix-turn-helix domain-containing protein n=1 Tax=Streptomyces sp. NBC_01171 TaxID=2903757 RepID=UPI00386468BD|nr:Scr1 family TA system antitoxin-like transcriptional regulator [Streptomyces sp. NBC_01171]
MAVEHGRAGNGESEASDGLKMFGAVMKSLRDQGRLTQEEFAVQVRYSAPYIAKIEQGKRFPPADLPTRVAPVLGEDAAKVLAAAAKTLTRRSGLASWFQQWAGIEEEAISLYAYECRAIPGLLQPETYARAVFKHQLPPWTEEQIDHKVAARLERQTLLVDRPHTAFTFIIEQAILDRRLGGPDVTKAVVDQLLSVGRRNNVEIQIMPRHKEDHCGVDGQMYLATTPGHQWFGYIEGHRSSTLIAQPGEVSVLHQRYGKLRSQALDCPATVELLEHLRGAL